MSFEHKPRLLCRWGFHSQYGATVDGADYLICRHCPVIEPVDEIPEPWHPARIVTAIVLVILALVALLWRYVA